ncbi:uracil-DNA glycosylase [Paenibacillus ginsengarvi]|uniref:Uracil-DNA glycosylase n=1 Tax=Paenibacillus ginsengarvi TaxID=400777 RepID=A0A3B0CK64_9BACL|nr:uracil-DNA glycosylase [Paenibacillus ginsengarvi]RKN85602.1 uracil-DNA glycosylase [Paenibacillus ginsengarvi]
MNFTPIILNEEPAPSHAVHCKNCELSKYRKRVVWGEGNPNASIFIVLDNPGLREDKEGNSFVCGTRETLQRGLLESGFQLNMVYVSYLLKCRPVRAYNKPLARDACSAHFQLQLEEKKPKLLLGLGNVVVESLFPELDTDVKTMRGRWHSYQGIPSTFSYHPLAVRRRPVLWKYFVEDLKFVLQKGKEQGLYDSSLE